MDFIHKIIAVIFFYCNFISFVFVLGDYGYNYVDLPNSHLPYYFNNFPQVIQQCLSNSSCIYRGLLTSEDYNHNKCWGYERNCLATDAFSRPKCAKDKPVWIPTYDEYVKTFYDQADFGYVRNQINELMVLCTPLFPNDSMLQCSENLRFCQGRNIMINFTELGAEKQPWRYRTDILKEGQIGGYCKLNKELLESQLEHMSALQSWAPELRNFVAFDERPIDTNKCDFVYEKPVYIMKIDANSNMYHHFCDFFNLYASLHVNMTHPAAFDTDNYIFLWETYSYVTPFSAAFKAFTQNPIFTIKAWTGKNVCFKNLMLPLLPRMIFGLYYNTPIIHGCQNSGLFQAFSDFMLHRLNIPLHHKSDDRIRITFLERKTKFRQILNSDELVLELKKNRTYDVRSVSFDRATPFIDQLEIIRNTDIFIGMHGAGLTHLLFLPKWATVFELYNCEDSECYKDLARLRGVNYMTWENKDKLVQQDEGHHPSGGGHAKFTNYSFDEHEFTRLVDKAADYVLNHDEFKKFVLFNFDSVHDEL
ncbi:EGF domain-specific O-linked N-acetylglucosamine transferase [Contarinia nasturtii]|uniref:EGF domain-specific O-linked N-acetylglucosamine transferase n=1 Tax=Contarinia nasturtii TaxID=265458 RepID=UPI0012D45425|nr:EGF domain-specific O-linked N-acetylglucosamine transferase [Contarinia nasturtii]